MNNRSQNKNLSFGVSIAFMSALVFPASSLAANFVSNPPILDGLSSSATGVFLSANSGSAQAKDFHVEISWSHTSQSVAIVIGGNAPQNGLVIFGNRVIACPSTVTSSNSYPVHGYGTEPSNSDCVQVDNEHNNNQREMWIEWEVYRCIPQTHPHIFFEQVFADDSGNLMHLSHDPYFLLDTAKQTEYLDGGSCRTLSPGRSVNDSLYIRPSSGGSGGSSGGGSGGSSGGGSGGGSGGNSSQGQIPPSPKVPAFNQFTTGPLFVTAGVAATLTGNRLGCTTEIQINDVATTFTRSYLGDGTQQLKIAIPANLQPGRHKMSMDSCGGQVEFSNLLVVPKAPAVFEMVTRNSIERGLALARLHSFLLTNMNDYNTVECIVNVKAPNLQTAARNLLADACNRAVGLLRATSSTSELRNTHLPTNIWIRVTLSNK